MIAIICTLCQSWIRKKKVSQIIFSENYSLKIKLRKYLLSKWKWKSLSHVRLFATPWTVAHQFLYPWNSPSKNTEVGSHSLLPGDLPNPGIKPRSPTLQNNFYHLSHQESPRIWEWGAYLFSRRSSRSRNWIRVSCIASRFFTSWGI